MRCKLVKNVQWWAGAYDFCFAGVVVDDLLNAKTIGLNKHSVAVNIIETIR
jgi:hypothetical protein